MLSLAAVFGFLFLAVNGMANAGSAQTTEIVISLRSEAHLEGRTFTLGDIADISGRDKKLISRLQRLLLGRTPRAGVSAKIDRDLVSARVEHLIPGVSIPLAWVGAPKINVLAKSYPLKQQDYLTVAQQHLNNWLSERYQEFSTKPVGQYDDLHLPAGSVTIEAEVGRRDGISKRMCVWVDLLVKGAHYSTLPVWFKVKAEAEVYVLRRDHTAGTPVIPEMLQINRRDIAAVAGVAVAELTAIEGQRLVRDLPSGAVLTEADIQPMPDITKGQRVRIQASVGKVTLFATARALEDGNRGDPIRVERLDGSDSYMARVLDNGMAIVEEDYR
jgi:flagella basal body P-ring formation protein FlgA